DDQSKRKRAVYIDEIQKIAQEIRSISRELNKGSFVGVDFKAVVEELVRNQPDTVSIELIIDKTIDWDEVSSNLKINAYRILQEALTNVYHHAQATTVKVEFSKKEGVFTLRIEDNGKGFKTGKT